MKRISLYLPEPYLKLLDELAKEKKIPNKAEAIRLAVRNYLREEGKL